MKPNEIRVHVLRLTATEVITIEQAIAWVQQVGVTEPALEAVRKKIDLLKAGFNLEDCKNMLAHARELMKNI